MADDDVLAVARSRLGQVLRGKYRLDRILGVGGMAVVYAATHRNRKRFAIKMLHPELSVRETIRTRFLREGYVANSVEHPGAVAVLDDDVAEDGSAFIVMELLEGATVDEVAARQGKRLPLGVALSVGDALLEVLVAAHDKQIVHRDLKPANLFLTRDGRLAVLDFGIARLHDATSNEATATGAMLGTPAFMAPEQALAESSKVDAQTDLWAVGATLFTLLTGQLVHPGDNASQLLVAAATKRARPLDSVAPEVPRAIAAVIDRALAFDKAERWPSARAMREALQRAAVEGTRAPIAALPKSETAISGLEDTIAPAADAGSTAFAPTVDSGGAPVPRRGATSRPLVLAGVGLLLLGGLVAVLALRARSGSNWAAPASSSAASAPLPPLRARCADGVKNDCGDGTRAWCDPDDKVIACCEPGLMATGKDGMCDCPPGGSLGDAGTSCSRSASAGVEGADAMITALTPKMSNCYERALADAGKLSGKLTIQLELSPEGAVYRARIKEGRIGSAAVQSCILDIVRSARFSAPPNGGATMVIPFLFARGDDAVPGDNVAAPSSVPGRHPCKARGSCATGASDWCDADEKELACCAPGLVAVGHDGLCECAPGGSTSPASGCPAADKAAWWKAFGAAQRAAFAHSPDCLTAADAGAAKGGVSLAFSIDPDGAIFDARITRGALPQIFAQQCVLDDLRGMKVPPPPDGFHREERIGIDIGGKPQ